ncbi:MAG: ubiquinol-cytochrome c reductase iron-sulfur subunit [Magnetospirillum sp.]|nr:ubiquinol-cytochrome c reductase iron-sulfur subunit [Magnetospirillum sp.]
MPDDTNRRDFLVYATAAMTVTGTALALWPFLDFMNPAADTLALATTDLDLAPIALGQRVTVQWQGKPVFVDHRTPGQITAARKAELAALPDPEPDETRVQKPEWLVVVGVCTHLGCIPLGQKAADPRGDWGGWFCPCHCSHYDTSARIRKGPAPKNLAVPAYKFTGESIIRIG